MRFMQNPPGPPGEVDESAFKNRAQQATFVLAEQLSKEAIIFRRDGDEAAARAKRFEAAEAFLAYTREYPDDSDIFRKAFYNVGQNYAEAGDYEQANSYFQQYVDRFPEDELSWPLTFRIALNYASTLELAEAVRYFEQLYSSAGKDYVDAPIALYNAAFLRIGMNDYRGAAQGFERYAREFPDIACLLYTSPSPRDDR